MIKTVLVVIWKLITGNYYHNAPTKEETIIVMWILFGAGIGIALIMAYININQA